METNHWSFPYRSQRMPVLAKNVVATSQPLAASAGLRMLLAGGNAVDAALAAAIALTVVEPTSNGIGSDAFAIVWDGKKLSGLNASGKSPLGLEARRFADMQYMPTRGWDPVTTPGAVSAWMELSKRFGKLPFADLFEPAIQYAHDGYALSPITAAAWGRAVKYYEGFDAYMETFAPGGRAPRPGETFKSAGHASTLREIAETEGESFYHGKLARQIAQAAEADGAAFRLEDLRAHEAEWVELEEVTYQGTTLHEIPPNGQGMAALIGLGLLEHLPLEETTTDSVERLHLSIEAMKLGLADAHTYFADPTAMEMTTNELIAPDRLRKRAKAIDLRKATHVESGKPARGGTVYLCAADANGMMVSFIQSNYMGFGSGIVIPGTGIALQNRGACFTLRPGHPNEVGPGKRPFHTIIPGFLTKQGQASAAFGVMGGHMQPQGHLQMVLHLTLDGQNAQAALDAPRWQVVTGKRVLIEQGFDSTLYEGLRARGHEIEIVGRFDGQMGGGQFALRHGEGYLAASDPRKDGLALGY